MDMKDWAKREVELACKRENPERKEGEWDYDCACYESALKAFESLLEDDHSGMSMGFTKAILNRLIGGKCLSPIEDTDDIWNYCHDRGDTGAKVYKCNRQSSLFKEVGKDGSVTYTDNNRVTKYDIDSGTSWHNGFVRNMIDELYPITMPYISEDKPYVVYCEDFLTDAANGDYDTMGILYLITPQGARVDINRFFKDGEENGYDEIDKEEYEIRRELAKKREEKLKESITEEVEED